MNRSIGKRRFWLNSRIASFSLGEILRTSGGAEVGDVQEKAERGLFVTVSDYGIQIVAWLDRVEKDARFYRRQAMILSRTGAGRW